MQFSSRQAYIKQALSRIRETTSPHLIFTSYASLLQWCCNGQEGRSVHEHLLTSGHIFNVFLGNCVIQMYRKYGQLQEARLAFESMPRRDIVSWNAIIAAHAKAGQCTEALRLFRLMCFEGVHPDCVSFSSVLGACATLKALEMGRRIHDMMKGASLSDEDVVLGTTIINMYAKCGSLQDAKAAFDSMPGNKSVIAWTSIMNAYVQLGQSHEALNLYKKMPFAPTRVTYIVILAACANLGDFQTGQEIENVLKCSNMLEEPSIGTAVLNMYAKCGRVDQARKVFDSFPQKNGLAWTSMIVAYAQHMQHKKALELWKSPEFQHLEPTSLVFVNLLGACAELQDLEEGKVIHKRIAALKLDSDLHVNTSLIFMYGSCGSVEIAKDVFENMKFQNLVAWNAIINVFAQHKMKEAFQFFQRMEQTGVSPDKVTFVSIFTACSGMEALEYGRKMHERVKCMGYSPDTTLGTALLNMYGKCHRHQQAYEVFQAMRHPDVVAWTAIISSYAQGGYHKQAMEMFKRMKSAGLAPNSATYMTILGSCSDAQRIQEGRNLHGEVVSRGLNREAVNNALLNMYCKCGSLQEARDVFDGMDDRSVVSYNTMFSAYVQLGHGRDVIELFKKMEVEPNYTTVILAICACANMGALDEGRALYASSQLPYNLLVQNSLIHMYGKCGALQNANEVFESLKQRNLVSWTSIIVGYAQHGHGREARALYQRMHLDGMQPDIVAFVSMLIACIHSGLVTEGRDYFLSMTGDWNIKPQAEHYVYMLDLLGKSGRLYEAEELARSMPYEPESVSWNTLIGACDLHNDTLRAKRLAGYVSSVYPESYVLMSNIYRREINEFS